MTRIARLDAAAARTALDDLAELLWDSVDGGASVNFVKPFGRDEARDFWLRVIDSMAAGGTVMLAAQDEAGRIAGTVLLGLDTPPNQTHRADVKKLLVHRRARRQGLARLLMQAVEQEARQRNRRLLTLDTEGGSIADGFYPALGYVRFGCVPGYAMTADGSRLADCAFFYKILA
ncbi:GNAT family N-acetyltransferase [Ferrovibrio sp.]|uniref:GNAT family N-acetyltransferase n=1 Tax=Ferrovibrio sp. TaxID=1917215 RepID=UPI003518E5C7